MINKNTAFLLIAIVAITYFSFKTTVPVLELSEAVKQKKVTVQIKSTGGFSGKCISLDIKNLSGGDLKVTIKPGTTFIPGDDGEQTLIAPSPQVIALAKSQLQTVPVSAFCTENHDRSPSSNSNFKIGYTTNTQLSNLIKKMGTLGPMDADLVQQSIWCLTDSNSVANVYGENPTQMKAMREYICSVTGQKDPWYTTKRVLQLDENRNIQSSPLEVKGKIELNNTKAVELMGVVKDETGKEVLKYPNPMRMPAGKVAFDFKLKVSGWEKGNYSVVYTCEGKEVLNQKFTI